MLISSVYVFRCSGRSLVVRGDHRLAARSQDWIRREWLIENQAHHIRDVTFREDLHQARTGTGPAVIATLRNTAIGWHRTNGDTTALPEPQEGVSWSSRSGTTSAVMT